MKPVIRVIEDDGDILIADSGEPFFHENEDGERKYIYRTATLLHPSLFSFQTVVSLPSSSRASAEVCLF